MKARKTVTTIIVILMSALFVVGAFVLINRKNEKKAQEEESVEVSLTQEILLHDLNRNYPPTPKEVMKFYSELTKCFYDPKLVESDMEALAKKARELYDDELVATQTEEEYMDALKEDILSFQSQNLVVSGYAIASFADVDYFEQDGFKWARLNVQYRLRQGTEYVYSNEIFLLRRDENRHWKIYGWTMDEGEKESAEESSTEE